MFIGPKTKEKAEKYRYGIWDEDRQGTAYNPNQCAAEAWNENKVPMFYQCSRKPGHGPAGLYCKQHSKMVKW